MQRDKPFEKDNFDENNPAHVAYAAFMLMCANWNPKTVWAIFANIVRQTLPAATI